MVSKNRMGVDMAHLQSSSMNEETLDKMVVFLKVLTHPLRLKIACDLLDGERSFSYIMQSTNQPLSTTSQQLSVMKLRGLTKTRRSGTSVYYSLSEDWIKNIIVAIRAEM